MPPDSRAHGPLVTTQAWTRTAPVGGVDNHGTGTNSNRIVLFEKD